LWSLPDHDAGMGRRVRRVWPRLSTIYNLSSFAHMTETNSIRSGPAEVGQTHADVSGGALRASVFGAMDGLVTNVALVAGVGAAGASLHFIVLTGLRRSTALWWRPSRWLWSARRRRRRAGSGAALPDPVSAPKLVNAVQHVARSFGCRAGGAATANQVRSLDGSSPVVGL
jgi:hypothetical protein